jgi:predicted RNA-binding Zn ribbon-like protein
VTGCCQPLKSYTGDVSYSTSRLALVEDFLNTLDTRSFIRQGVRLEGTDALDTPTALTNWFRERSLADRRDVASTSDLDAARALRHVLRQTVDPNVPSPTDPTDILGRLTFRLRIDRDGKPSLGQVPAGIEGALTRVVTTFAEGLADGSWWRLRLCASPECRWAFRDTSKAGTRRWCSMSSCGNRHKARTRRGTLAAS